MKKYLASALAIITIGMLAMPLMGASFQTLPVPARTRILIQLDTGISSKTNRAGDRFTATVISPLEYEGATVRGHISQLKESGKIKGKTEMTLEFDTIELRNGSAAPLNAELLEVRRSESVKVVDEEGRIETGSRGEQSIKRGAIGAAIGGVLGGLIGGGKGALIGILIGGGAGAGSLIIDGEKELRLESGTEMEIRALKASASEEERFRPTRNLIMDVQHALNEQGYEAGPVDGLVGPQTRSALARFQRDNGLPETGRIDRETARKLGLDN
ncbi:MAG: peptidoglycan-binding protein [Blastocatellia bacterium]|nr:peptidoglycan-binding protein [Blastocatellia bacterium]